MKSISVELPDNLASAVESYVKADFFRSELDVLLAALSEFVRRNRIELKERFAHEDIEWGKKGSSKSGDRHDKLRKGKEALKTENLANIPNSHNEKQAYVTNT